MQNKNDKSDAFHIPLDVLLETAVDGIISIDSNGIIHTFNPAAEKLFGYSTDEVIGKSINMLMPEPYSSEHDSYLKNYETTRVKKIIGIGREAVGKQKDGSVFPMRLSVGEAEVDGKAVYVGFVHDITESKNQENEIKKHRDHLQALVDERTEELSIANEELQKLANIDSLTGLPNRRSFDETLQKEIQRAVRHKHALSLLMCDIDFFKKYNDTYGHLAGDECLIKVADCMKTSFKRASDLPARYGGEEFAVILPHTETEEALKLSNLFIENIKKLKIEHKDSDVSEFVTLSIGLVTVIPDKISVATTLIDAADKALYAAKHNGRNRIEVGSLT
jgi:diguanylate cyclase (GGDEF)-like protein/PAS domain S-box-containing protein